MTSAEIIAELIRQHIEGVPLAIHHPLGGRRHVAEIYATDRGFVFADIGGDDSLYSGHPFHVVEGTAAAGEGGQVLIAHTEGDLQGRRSVVYPVRPDLDSDDPAARDAARWRDWLSSGESHYPGRGFGLQKAQMLDPTARL